MNTTDCEKIEGKFSKVYGCSKEPSQEEKCERDDGVEGQLDEGEQFTFSNCEKNNCSAIEVNDSRLYMHETESSPTQNEAKGQPTEESQLLTTIEFQDGEFGDQLADFDEQSQPLSERWSPLGANYDDAVSPISELLSPESEMELLSSDSQDKQEVICNDEGEMTRLRNMEEEQELLTSSLMALTSHFAHVQLRVRQIVEAPPAQRDQLLRDLEEFAFRGIPESVALSSPQKGSVGKNGMDEGTLQRQFELIEQLKTQLSDLEKLAYESGAPVLPQHILLEKQKIIIDELKQKLNLRVDEQDLPQLSPEELKSQVDNAIGEFVGPLKMKDQLVAQLKTQITDLERFIAFLQCDSVDGKIKTLTGSDKFADAYNSYAAKKKVASARARQKLSAKQDNTDTEPGETSAPNEPKSDFGEVKQKNCESLNAKAHLLLDKASLLMHMFAASHFGLKSEHFQKNTLKKTSKGNHWGDLRAQLEVDIQEVASLAATLSFDREKLASLQRAMRKSLPSGSSSSNCNALITAPPRANQMNKKAMAKTRKPRLSAHSSDSDDDAFNCYYELEKSNRRMARGAHYMGDSIITISKELTSAVRKNFCITLQRLIQHGLRVENESAAVSLFIPFMRCLHPSPVLSGDEHAYSSRDLDHANFLYSNDEGEEEGRRSGFFGSSSSRPMHAWELILEYYYLKNGDEFNNTPARKLSESFNLDIADSRSGTPKQTLLSGIGDIIAMHRPYKRSYNAHFKAFISEALNQHKLVEWLHLIFNCTELVETYYTVNSYVARTGFRDALRSIEQLNKYDFDLPVDLAVRHFREV